MTGSRPRLPAGPLLVLATLLVAAQPQPASAQSFLDNLFGGKEEAKPEQAPEPEAATDPAAKKGAQKSPKDKAAATAPEKTGSTKGSGKGGATASPGSKVAAVGAPNAGEAVQDADAGSVLERANAYFNGFQTLTGNFMQIGADGRKIGGKIYLVKPGRLRFAYDEPSPLEIVADGTSVAVRDRKLATQDLYFISQTPLKFLLRDKIDLSRDLDLKGVTNEPAGYRISLEDRSTLGGTSKIQLYFDSEMKTLSQWRITDPQGYLTTVQLANLQKGKAVDGTLFFINYGRAEDKAMQRQIEGRAQ